MTPPSLLAAIVAGQQRVAPLPSVEVLRIGEHAGPTEAARALETSSAEFATFPLGKAAPSVPAAAALALRYPQATMALDDRALRRSDRRALRSEGLRFLDPTAAATLVFERRLALTCLAEPAVTAAGRHWRWALARLAASRTKLTFEDGAATRRVASRLPVVEFETLARFAGAADTPLVLVIGRIEASVSLYFDGLPPGGRPRLVFAEAEALLAEPGLLAIADAAIIVRDLERCDDLGILRMLEAIRLPRAYFLDDNPMVLAEEDRHWRYYKAARLRDRLAGFDAVLASTEPLAEALRAVHDRVSEFGPVLDAGLVHRPPEMGGAVRAAIAGGNFRRDASLRDVMPALLEHAAETPGAALLVPNGFGAPPSGSYQTREMPRIGSFPQFVRHWRDESPNMLLHPRGQTRNDRFKTPNALLVALYLGALPIVDAEEPAYAGLGEAEGVLKAMGSDGWAAAIRRARQPDEAGRLWSALHRGCERLFGSEAQCALLNGLVAARAPVDAAERAARLRLIARLRRGNPAWLRPLRRLARRLADP